MLLLALTLTLGAGTAIAGGLGIGGAPVARAATSGTCDSSSDTCGSYHYRSSGGGCADGYVNQNNYNNVWVTFGSACTTDGAAEITLADDGGDSYPKQVGADAIRAVPTSYLC